MTIYLAWSDTPFDPDVAGPWTETHAAADALLLVRSDDTLSRVYHELKWSLPDDAALLVAPLTDGAKLKHVAPGTQSWLRRRLPS